MNPAPLHRWRFGTAEFDEARFELRVGGLLVDLQKKPLQLLALLLATPGEVVTKDRIFSEVWNDRATGDAVLANAASKLRSALGPANAVRIATVARQGYRFEGEVERLAVGRRQASELTLIPGMAVPGRNGHRLVRRLGPATRHDTWLAEQPRTGDRRVFKFALDGERLAELKREVTLARVLREALGEREDFTRVLDWRFDAPPYWVESAWGGETLDAWAAAPEGAGTRLAALSPEARVALALQMADALAAAHGAGVLHQDLKPANVLVAPAGTGWQLRLTDFGSGRLLDPEQLERLRVTRLGMTLDAADAGTGTPYYIAPELLSGGRPGTASDVFALGVMLFQLLAGDLRRPLAPGWEREVDDELLREDIAAATDIDPARRLPNAAALVQRLRALAERRGQRQAERAAAAAAEAARAELARLQAMARQHETVQALNRLLREDLVGAANPALHGRTDITVAEALSGAAAAVDTKYADLPDVVRGGLHAAMQQALSELSRAQEAVLAGRRAVAALSAALQSAGGDGPPTLRQDLQEARLRLALDLVQVSRLDESAAQVAAIEAEAGPESAQPVLFRARLLFVKSWLTAGDLSLQASLAQLEQAAALVRPLPDESTPVRGSILFALADNLVLLGRLADAEAQYRALLAEQLRRHGEEHPRPAYTRVGLASALARLGRLAEARELLQDAGRVLAARMGSGHRQTLTALDMLADVCFREADWAAAAARWAEVQAGYAALMGEGSSYVLTVQTNRAAALHRGGDAAGAEPMLDDALQRARAILPADAPQVQQIRVALAECRLDLRRTDSVPALLEGLSAEALNLAQPEPDWPARLWALRQRAGLP